MMRMKVKDVFYVMGRGLVCTGVPHGLITSGDFVAIADGDVNGVFLVRGVEVVMMLSNPPKMRDEIGLNLVPDDDNDVDLKPGDWLFRIAN